jgi:hypothetical protein
VRGTHGRQAGMGCWWGSNIEHSYVESQAASLGLEGLDKVPSNARTGKEPRSNNDPV